MCPYCYCCPSAVRLDGRGHLDGREDVFAAGTLQQERSGTVMKQAKHRNKILDTSKFAAVCNAFLILEGMKQGLQGHKDMVRLRRHSVRVFRLRVLNALSRKARWKNI